MRRVLNRINTTRRGLVGKSKGKTYEFHVMRERGGRIQMTGFISKTVNIKQ
jgi:hypothetical protein